MVSPVEYIVGSNLNSTVCCPAGTIIDQCIDQAVVKPGCSAIRTVHKAAGIDHPYWMFREREGFLEPFIDGIDLSKYYQRQLLPDCFKINGVVDVLKPQVVQAEENIYGSKIGFVEIPEINAIDIDTPLDFAFAEYLINQEALNKD